MELMGRSLGSVATDWVLGSLYCEYCGTWIKVSAS